jgi:catechol 2,3-dioxygenase-like lactoylglutathione lyase family enzyme
LSNVFPFPTIIGIHHTQIAIPRNAEAAAREFYCSVRGLTQVAKPDILIERGGFWVAVGDINVLINAEDGVD